MDLFQEIFSIREDFFDFDQEVDALAFGRVCTHPYCTQALSGELTARLKCPVCGSPTFGFSRVIAERVRALENNL